MLLSQLKAPTEALLFRDSVIPVRTGGQHKEEVKVRRAHLSSEQNCLPVIKTHQPTCFGEDLGCWYSINSTGGLKEKSSSGLKSAIRFLHTSHRLQGT